MSKKNGEKAGEITAIREQAQAVLQERDERFGKSVWETIYGVNPQAGALLLAGQTGGRGAPNGQKDLPTQNRPFTRARPKEKRRVFLEVYSRMGNIELACESAGINRTTFTEWKANDAKFASQVQEAFDCAADVAEAAAYKRAVFGVQRGEWMKGADGHPQKVETVTEYSDRLLEKILEARRPEFSRKQIEMSGPGGAPLPGQSVQIVIAGAVRASDPAPIETPAQAKQIPDADTQGGS